MPMWPGGPPYPWEPGGAWNQGGGQPQTTPDPSQPIGGGVAAPAASPADLQPNPAAQKTLAALIAAHGPIVGVPAPVTYKDLVSGAPKTAPGAGQTYTFQDQYTAVVGPNGELGDINPPKKDTSAAATNTTADRVVQGSTIYQKRQPTDPGYNASDPSTWWVASQVDADTQAKSQADVKKTLSDIGYTDAQIAALQAKNPAEIQQILAATNLSAANQQKVLQDMQIAQAKLGGELAQQAASTVYTEAQTGQLKQATDIAAQKAPGEIALTAAQAAAQQANAARVQQQITQGNAPQIVQPGTGLYTYTQDPNTGQLTPQYNANFQAKTMGDVASRVGQLQSMAQAQRDQINTDLQSGKFGTGPEAQQKAAALFDSWWNQNVEPQKAGLQAAQQTAYADQQRLQAEQDRQNYATALGAGQNAVEAAKAEMPYMVGPGYGAAVNQIANAFASGKPAGNLDIGSAITFNMPDLNALAAQATNQALAHLSPTAAAGMNAATGPNTPNYAPSMAQPMDVNAGLNRQSYQFGTPQAQQQALPVQQPAAPITAAPANAVPGQTYGATTAYTGGILPWNAQPLAVAPTPYVYGGV